MLYETITRETGKLLMVQT